MDSGRGDPNNLPTGALGDNNGDGFDDADDDKNGIINDIGEAMAIGSDDVILRESHSRLFRLTDAFNGSSEANRRAVTTESYDPPVPSVQIPDNLRNSVVYGDGGHAVQLLRAKMAQDPSVQALVGGYSIVLREYALNLLMSWSKGADGAWGVQGMDDDGNGVTDDLLEAGFAGSDDTRSPY